MQQTGSFVTILARGIILRSIRINYSNCTLILVTYNSLQGVFNEKLGGTIFELLPYSPFVFQLAGLLVLIGALIGMWGSVMSIRRFLKV